MIASHELRTARCVVTEQVEVFDIVYETNAVALAWMPPRRQTARKRSLDHKLQFEWFARAREQSLQTSTI